MKFAIWIVVTGFAALAALAQPGAPKGAPPPPMSSAAEKVYELARPRIVQVRTLLVAAGRQSSIGSGFLVSADGLAITNYHVVSQFALEPATYRLEYLAPDGAKGTLQLLAIDVANDLAVVRLDRQGLPHFAFDPRALADRLPKGERIYALGNPLDLGFTIVEGTYNGLVDKSYDERIHFSGAINPGMSGGPVAGSDGRVVGVNVAKRTDGEQVGFLVPARFAAALLERARTGAPLAIDRAKEEVGRQIDAWQGAFHEALAKQGFKEAPFGPYLGLESAAPWITCWAGTNSGQIPKPRAAVNTTRCSSETGLFVSDRIVTGRVEMSFSWYRAVELNAFQFAKEISNRLSQPRFDAAGKRLTEQECRDGFVATGGPDRPPLRVTWCARAFREFAGLYNVTVLALTQDRSREALVATLSMQGVSWANSEALGRRFLESIRWAR